MRNNFKNYDKDANGTIEKGEFGQVLKDMGYDEVSEEKLAEMFSNVDLNKDGVVDWEEFLNIMDKEKVKRKTRKSMTVELPGLSAA